MTECNEPCSRLAADIAVMNTQVTDLRIRADACRLEAEDLLRQLEEKRAALEDCIRDIARDAIGAAGRRLQPHLGGDENV